MNNALPWSAGPEAPNSQLVTASGVWKGQRGHYALPFSAIILENFFQLYLPGLACLSLSLTPFFSPVACYPCPLEEIGQPLSFGNHHHLGPTLGDWHYLFTLEETEAQKVIHMGPETQVM